jgi:glycerol-3-phosphate dehydrogenase
MDSEVLDLLVVGAGATGTGTALDAAARGMSVGLIDKGDIAVGTSSRSSQLVHGGLRYLQQGNVALVRESLRERELLLTTLAPHLVRPLPFMLPLTHRVWERFYMGAGLTAYDLLARSGALPRHRHRSRAAALARFPSLRPEVLVGAVEYYDAQMDDARLAVAIARTAALEGARVATHTALVGDQGVGADGIRRVSLRDELTGEEFTVSARCIALCVGVWAPEASAIFTGADEGVSVTRSKGIHLRLPRRAIDGETALIVPTSTSVLFVIPTPTHWLVGTTDTEWLADPEAVEPTSDDVDYLLGLLAGVLSVPITAQDVTYVFAGLRPLVRDHAVGGDTAKVTREHRIARVVPGVLAIVGGKWTTYRVMARDLVDSVLIERGLPPRRCTTDTIPLVGSGAPLVDVADATLSLATREMLVARYGSRVSEVAAIVADDPSLAESLIGAPGFLRAEVVHACVNEGACTLDDVVSRRLRLRLHLDSVSNETIADVASVMDGILAQR